MANDTIILSPEYAGNTGRAEGLADAALKPGNLVTWTATGIDVSTALLHRTLIVTENISVAGGVDVDYTVGENVFAAALPVGAVVKATMAAATYAPGDELEITSNGRLAAVGTGRVVAVVPGYSGATVSNDDLMIVQLV